MKSYVIEVSAVLGEAYSRCDPLSSLTEPMKVREAGETRVGVPRITRLVLPPNECVSGRVGFGRAFERCLERFRDVSACVAAGAA